MVRYHISNDHEHMLCVLHVQPFLIHTSGLQTCSTKRVPSTPLFKATHYHQATPLFKTNHYHQAPPSLKQTIIIDSTINNTSC